MVARTLTSTIRLLDAMRLLRDDFRVNVVFTVNDTSHFSRGARELLRRAGVTRIEPWRRVRAGRVPYSLAVSASENVDFDALTTPTVVLPHGIGFNKYVPDSDGEHTRLAGLPPVDALRAGRVRLVLSHPEQEAQLRAACPDVAGHTVVTGDPTYEELLAALPLRDRYRRGFGTGDRKLVLLTSTWRSESQMGRRPELPERLLAELPCDEYQVVLALHPNIWSWYGRHRVRNWLDSALSAGLLLLPPERGWQAALLAADHVIGDHGSVTLYAAALDKPLLLAAMGAETVPGTPVAELGRRAGQLDPSRPLRPQLEHTTDTHRSGCFRAITERVFADVDGAGEALRDVLYAELGLAPPDRPPPIPRPPDVEPERNAVTAFDVRTEFTAPATVSVVRHPRAVRTGERVSETSAVWHLAVDEAEPNLRLPRNASVLVRRERAEAGEATRWASAALTNFPGARVAAAATAEGCVAHLRDGSIVQVTTVDGEPDPLLLASAVYARSLTEGPFDGELTLRVGSTTATLALRTGDR